ncbi:flavin-containing monooxygenase [Mycobacterium sp. SMC-4]|uniref:flavin-containing monooxygenase n=1 Tax=Mycobacterium sp. SMC-4 TaxID=2857059 RepID=UPI003D024744
MSGRPPRVAIIGAGFGGLGVALKLAAAGHHNFVVYERADDIGGTWHVNTYPGAACDAPSYIYSYSFAQEVDWSRRFATGPEIKQYLQRCVARAGISERIRTGTEVVAACWTGTCWTLTFADGQTAEADVLVPALGQLTEPFGPDLAGLETFAGPAFHTARWRHDIDLTGKRVAVIGTGASAVQVVPAVAPHADHVTVFQRSAPYVFGKADSLYSERLHRRHRSVPALRSAIRLGIWSYFELVTMMFTRRPGALSLLGRMHSRVLASRVADPRLRDMLRPNEPIGCKRILISDDYYATLARPDVTLETAGMECVTPTGIVCVDGTHHRADVIVFATGFVTTPFVSTLTVTGRGGQTLTDAWAQRAAAFLGLSLPGFPNMFLVYGPNTNLGSGSIVYMLEAQADHIVSAVTALAATDGATIEIAEQAFRDFLSELDSRQPRTVWQACRSWYRDTDGHDTHNWPWLMSSYRRRTRRIRPAEYLVTPRHGSDDSAPA